MIEHVKRAESMTEPKRVRRTPSFTIRRRTQSFRRLQSKMGPEQMDQLPPVEIQGLLDRKHELQSGGKRAAVRSWKTLYTGKCQLQPIYLIIRHVWKLSIKSKESKSSSQIKGTENLDIFRIPRRIEKRKKND